MAHHGSEIPEELRELFGQIAEKPVSTFMSERARELARHLQQPFGATGRFPQGKLNESDEGEIMMGVAADKKAGKVIINFGKPTAWVGMDREQAIALADSLRQKADELPG